MLIFPNAKSIIHYEENVLEFFRFARCGQIVIRTANYRTRIRPKIASNKLNLWTSSSITFWKKPNACTFALLLTSVITRSSSVKSLDRVLHVMFFCPAACRYVRVQRYGHTCVRNWKKTNLSFRDVAVLFLVTLKNVRLFPSYWMKTVRMKNAGHLYATAAAKIVLGGTFCTEF